MADTPKEYSVLYRYTAVSNRTWGTGTERTIPKGSFKKSGATTRPIGKITRIAVKHYHSCAKKGYNFTSYARVNWSGGSVQSSGVNLQFNWDVKAYTHTITKNLPTPEQFDSWTGVTIGFVKTSNLSELYWRATSDDPLDVTVYFYDAHDLCQGAAPPTVSGVACADDAGLRSTFGNYVQNYSRAVITGQYTTDKANYPYLVSQHTLELSDANGASLYAATQEDDAVFDVGALASSGTISWTYTINDSAGNSASKSGTFSVLPYAPPSVVPRASGVNIAQRYATSVDDTGKPVYTAAGDGDHVWFDLALKVTAIASKNAWTLSLAYGQGDPTEAAGKQIASGADGASAAVKTYTNDRTLVTDTVSPAAEYWFRLTATDKVTSASLIVYVDKAASLFNVEEHGAAVGMYSTATATQKLFEVAPTHETRLYGGLMGVTNYVEGEVDTGGHWIDGEPIYRFVGVYNKIATGLAKISNVGTVLSLRGMGRRSDGTWSQLPTAHSTDFAHQTLLAFAAEEISIGSKGALWSNSTGPFIVIMEYTKTDPSSAPALPEGPEIMDDFPYADPGVARADYIAMMTGIEIPTDAASAGAQLSGSAVQSAKPQTSAPQTSADSQITADSPSPKYELVKLYHDARVWNEAMVAQAVGKWITAAEAKEILAAQSP